MVENEQTSFNLVDDPWIMVKLLTGETIEVSLLGAFRHASKIECLANDLPTQDFAILRVLLAVLQRSALKLIDEYDYPSDAWGSLWEAKELPIKAIESYLYEWRHRFELLEADQPFMQVKGLTATNGSVSEVKKIIADVPDGKPLFSLMSLSGLDSLGFDEAARWLIHVQAFDTSGIKTGVKGDVATKGGKSYPIGTSWAGNLGGIYLEGNNLTETLLLNLVLCDSCHDSLDEWVADDDIPAWERQQTIPGSSGRTPLGHADVYTWQSRRVRIVADHGRAIGVVLTNGDRLDAFNRMDVEPMTSWRRSANQEKKLGFSPVYLPYKHRSGRAIWRGLTSILPWRAEESGFMAPGVLEWASYLSSVNGGGYLERDYRLKTHATAFEYGTQSSVVTELIDDAMTFSSYLLTDAGKTAATAAERCLGQTDDAVAKALGSFAFRLRLAAGDDSERASGVRDAVKAEAYFELDGPFRSWLANLDSTSNLNDAESQWRNQARSILIRLARRLAEGAGPEAIIGRKAKLGNVEAWLSAGDEERRFHYLINRALPLDNDSQEAEKEGQNG